MSYQSELQFLLNFFKNHEINVNFYTCDMDFTAIDLHLRKLLGWEQEYAQMKNYIFQQYQPNVIYKIIDQFNCVYYFMQLPEQTASNPLIIGPYMLSHLKQNILMQHLEIYSISLQIFQELQKVFHQIPVLTDDTSLQTFLQTFGEIVWDNADNFQIRFLNYNFEEFPVPLPSKQLLREEYLHFDIQFFKSYSAQENSLIQAVSQGQAAKAEDILSRIYIFSSMETEQNPLYHLKNYATTLNVLFRKTAELNTTNFHQLFSVYSKFIYKIEHCTSPKSCKLLLREIIRKYSILNKNHSMKQYSALVQQVIKQVDTDLTADLSLHTMAAQLNVNASYLSTHFKKVTGTTYTDYVNRKRIDHSLLLLNTSTLQIQTIAQYCGIPDLNYFTKLFKKYIHMSPTSYRKEMLDK